MTRPTKSQVNVGAEAKIGEQHDWPAAETVGHCSQNRGENELHERPNGSEKPVHSSRFRCVAAEKAGDEIRQDGDNHADGEHVEDDGDENKDERGAARRFGRGSTRWSHARNESVARMSCKLGRESGTIKTPRQISERFGLCEPPQ
jgi:hypothetical protein